MSDRESRRLKEEMSTAKRLSTKELKGGSLTLTLEPLCYFVNL